MKKNQHYRQIYTQLLLTLFFSVAIGVQNTCIAATNSVKQDSAKYHHFKGKVIDSKTKKPLVFASISVNETNISTVTNTQGMFLLKVPEELANQKVTVSFLGYTSKVLNLSDFNPKKTIIKLETYIEELPEINIITKDANLLVKEVFKKTGINYFTENITMTAFYRETIKKRRTYVSLAEAVVEIQKQSYTSTKTDLVKLYKSRKNSNYKKMDTLAVKLKGGPFNTLSIDVMKYPELTFTEEMLKNYDFSFGTSTKIDNRPIYVVNFKPKPAILTPLYYGKLYIDAKTLALTSAQFKLNLANRKRATKVFILKKPKTADVYPIEATYRVDYREKNGKWVYSYSRIQLGFKVNWHKRLFNSVYYTTIEMAITDWKNNTSKTNIKPKDRLRKSVIMSEKASNFSDPEFWGAYNVIEPEKSIETAIKKIQKQLKKLNR